MRYKCQECEHACDEGAILTAVNPFDPLQNVHGCPKCFAVDQMIGACDEPGCNEFSSCGWPTPDGGYRVTCGKHWMPGVP